jgi:hypothetical protein
MSDFVQKSFFFPTVMFYFVISNFQFALTKKIVDAVVVVVIVVNKGVVVKG